MASETSSYQLRQLVECSDGIAVQSQGKLSFCEACVQGKCHRQPHYPLKTIRSKEKLELVHTDVCGPMQTQSFGGSRYFITFIDDYSRYCYTYFLKKKSEALEKFKEFKASVENEFKMKIKALRADRGGEYLSNEFQQFLKECAIRPEFTAAYSSQQNGVSERLNRMLLEAARSMLSHADLSNAYWAEAVATATCLRNCLVSTALKAGETPYLLWYGKKPNLEHIRVFGCVVYSHILSENRKKLDKKAQKLRFIGYTETARNYKVWDEEKRKCYIYHDVIFYENDFGKSTGANKLELENIEEESVAEIPVKSKKEESDEENEEQLEPLRRSQRIKRPPVRYGNDEFTNIANVANYQAAKIEEPKTINDAFNSDHSQEWKVAADFEYSSLIENQTWDLVKLPEGHNIVGCKWVFRVKHDGNGKVNCFKGRLVAQGFSQRHGVDYEEIFSPVVHLSSIRTLLAFAAKKKLHVHQMDVVSAFLNGELKEEIYMKQPPGYVQSGKENLVCKLRKSIYGLKQSPRCWNQKLCDHLKSLGFKESGADSCVFIKNETSTLKIIAVYVDDLILIAKSLSEMQQMKDSLSKTFKMKDMGQLHYCLGINFELTEQGISLCQKQYLINYWRDISLQKLILLLHLYGS